MRCSGKTASPGGGGKDHRRSEKSSFPGKACGDRHQRDLFRGILYEEESEQYKKELGQINQKLAEMAEEVVEVVYGIPVWHKGGKEA